MYCFLGKKQVNYTNYINIIMLKRNTIKYLILFNALICIIRVDRYIYTERYYYEEPLRVNTELVIDQIPVLNITQDNPGIIINHHPVLIQVVNSVTPLPEFAPVFYNNYILHQLRIYSHSFSYNPSLISILHKKNITHQSSESDLPC
jgi:hypothetical protein